MARPPAEGWREYKRCFCTGTLLTGCKVPRWLLVALLRSPPLLYLPLSPMLLGINAFSHALARTRSETCGDRTPIDFALIVQREIRRSFKDEFLNSDAKGCRRLSLVNFSSTSLELQTVLGGDDQRDDSRVNQSEGSVPRDDYTSPFPRGPQIN